MSNHLTVLASPTTSRDAMRAHLFSAHQVKPDEVDIASADQCGEFAKAAPPCFVCGDFMAKSVASQT